MFHFSRWNFILQPNKGGKYPHDFKLPKEVTIPSVYSSVTCAACRDVSHGKGRHQTKQLGCIAIDCHAILPVGKGSFSF